MMFRAENLRGKLFVAVLAALLAPQLALAAPGGKLAGVRSKLALPKAAPRSTGPLKLFSQPKNNGSPSNRKRLADQNNAAKTATGSTSGQPIPAKNGNTGINGSGLPDQVVPFPNGNTGINGSGAPSNTTASGNATPFPNGNTGINGSGAPKTPQHPIHPDRFFPTKSTGTPE